MIKTSGVYSITCTVTGKQYVGSSSHIKKRWQDHVYTLNVGTHANQRLQHAWAKYGADAFVFTILEATESDIRIGRELYWVGLLLPAFNIKQPNLEREAFVQPAETRRKISEANKGKHLGIGHKHTEEAKRKIAIWRTGRPGPSPSDETRRKLSEANKSLPRSDEHRKNLSKAGMGHVLSEETRRKISETLKRKHSTDVNDNSQ